MACTAWEKKNNLNVSDLIGWMIFGMLTSGIGAFYGLFAFWMWHFWYLVEFVEGFVNFCEHPNVSVDLWQI